MHLDSSVVDAIFARHGMSGPWKALPSLGLANRIFATDDVVLRVATDHPDGFRTHARNRSQRRWHERQVSSRLG